MSTTEATTPRAPAADAPLDLKGEAITPSRLRRAMRLNIAVGIGGAAFMIACGPPQDFMAVFFKKYLGASPTQLGLLVAIAHFSAIFNLLSPYLFGRLKTRKTLWAVAHTVHRLHGFVLAGLSLYLAYHPEARSVGILIVFISATVSWVLHMATQSGWWAWMADLIPENIRGTFFGRRGQVIRVAVMLLMFGMTSLVDLGDLDPATDAINAFFLYAIIFAVGGALGVVDIVVHYFIPEPARHEAEPSVGWSEFLAPLKNRNFVAVAITFGLWQFSAGVLKPFLWPYVTETLGAPQKWMGISYVISNGVAILVMPAIGILMDRFGRKPIVVVGSLMPMSWIGFLIMTPDNYMFLIPGIALVRGLLMGAVMLGFHQLMLSLTPERNRTTFVSWYWALGWLVAAVGPYTGGFLRETVFAGFEADVLWIHATDFHLTGLVSLVLVLGSVVLLARVREGKEKPVGYVVARLLSPSFLRTFVSLGAIGFTPKSERAARALRTLDNSGGALAMDDTLARLDDPDVEVREEAARALGRIGSTDAVEALVERLGDPESSIRPQAAWALGQIGDTRAIPALIDALHAPSDELQQAAAQALGQIGGKEPVRHLRQLMQEDRAERVIVSGAEAVSKHGVIEAAWEILPHMHRTSNPVLRRQLAIAMGNLLGHPGEFYEYLTGEQAQEGARLGRLFRGVRRSITAVLMALPASSERDATLAKLSRNLERIRGLIEGRSYRAAVEDTCKLIRRVGRLVTGHSGRHEEMMKAAFHVDAKLGLGVWFADDIRHRMGRVEEPEIAQIDALLALYFLASYRLPEGM